MITLYGIANCDTIKKTRAWLDQADIAYEFHDYRKHGSPESLIRKLIRQFTYGELINKRGTTWRSLSDHTRDSLDQNSAITLMSKQPAIIKRPLLQSDSNWLLGFDETRLRDFVAGDCINHCKQED